MHRLFTRCLLVSGVSVAASCAAEEPAPADTAAHSAGAAAPAPRMALLKTIGPYHREIQTTSPEAQRFFDEGLNLLYGFNHDEAFASFRRAAALDPKAPMPQWGMALALGTNINDPAPAERLVKARMHLAPAVRLLSNGSPVEEGLVAALGMRYADGPLGDQQGRERAYSEAMRALSERFPDDADVAALYAESMMNLHPWKLYKADGTPEPWTPVIVATLERVLKKHERHPGANHYYIHAVEASRTPSRANRAAERLETLVPGAGHLVHMPAHIYIRTGQFTKAAQSNADAAKVDEAYFAGANPQSFYALSYYGHNLQFESAAAMYGGNFSRARRAAQKTVTLEDPAADQMAMLEPFAAQDILVLARFGAWAELLTLTPPVATRTIQSGLYRWARGVALSRTGRVADAASELDSLRAITRRVPKDAMVGMVNWGGDVLAVAIADLHGQLLEAKGDTNGAVAAYRAAVAAEDRLGYNEPPDWLFPERERLGVALLTAGKPVEAERVFREDLTKHVGNPRSLYGLFLSAEAQRKGAGDEARRAFDIAWRDADVVLGPDLYIRR